jgi:membrane fusion protein (multidrug efflux system)
VKKIKLKYWAIPVVLILGLTIVWRSGVYAGDKTQAVNAGTAVSVKAVQAEYSDSVPSLVFNGSLEGQTSATVSAKISGRIAEVLVQEGQQVKAGDPLIRLESVELANSARQADDAVRKAQINYDLAKNDYERYQRLYEKGAISAQQLENTSAKLKIAEADLSSSAANQGSAEQQLAYSTITAPVDGVVANKTATIGQVVSPGVALLTVQDISQVYAVINVEQKNLGVVKEGQAANVSVDAYPGKTFAGTVEVMNPEAGAANRMFRTKIKLENAAGELKPGMFANVQLVTGDSVKVLTVPQAAVIQKQGMYYVFQVQDGKAVRTQIEVGAATGSTIEVKSGLEAGAQVIATSVNRLKDGDAVRAVP